MNSETNLQIEDATGELETILGGKCKVIQVLEDVDEMQWIKEVKDANIFAEVYSQGVLQFMDLPKESGKEIIIILQLREKDFYLEKK